MWKEVTKKPTYIGLYWCDTSSHGVIECYVDALGGWAFMKNGYVTSFGNADDEVAYWWDDERKSSEPVQRDRPDSRELIEFSKLLGNKSTPFNKLFHSF